MILSLIFTSALISSVLTQNDCEKNRLNSVKGLSQPLRGSNLGSWFVLESWMASHVWDDNGCDKTTQGGSYLLEKCLGGRASDVMHNHWSSFITENDFAEMSSRGVNVVRIPVGWWQIYDPQGGPANANLNYYVDPVDYTVGALEYIDKAFDWGEKHGIAVILSMHAAPGSQNGNDHSSPAEYPGQINWDKFDANVGQTIDSIGLFTERYANRAAFFGWILLNEPAYVDRNVLQDFYKRAYDRVRQHSSTAWTIINPLISPFESGSESYWTDFMNPDQGYHLVAMDLHFYSCFGGDADQSNADGAINYIKWDRLYQIKDYMDKNPKRMFIGEWSACGHFSVDRVGEFTQAQVDTYNTADLGWSFWSWTDGSTNNVWSMKTAFNSGWMQPQYPC